MTSFPPQSTPVPNILLDTLMPELTDTELRVVLVVVRQTLGWAAGDGRKVRDWISHRQLMAKTGRESAAISRSVERLVQKRILVAEGEDGQPLTTPSERRAVRGRVYFHLHPRLRKKTSLFEEVTAHSEARNAESDAETVLSEDTKAKTTKETRYKKLSGSSLLLTLGDDASTGEHVGKSQVIQFLHRYRARFCERSLHQFPPPLSWSREGQLARELLEQYDLETLASLLDAFFLLKDTWVREQGYSLHAFRHRLPRLLVQSHPEARETSGSSTHRLESKANLTELFSRGGEKRQEWHFDPNAERFVPTQLQPQPDE